MVGYVVGMGEMGIAYRILVPEPKTERKLSRHCCTWQNGTQMDFVEIIMTI
jgi:hypothetical protein